MSTGSKPHIPFSYLYAANLILELINHYFPHLIVAIVTLNLPLPYCNPDYVICNFT